MSRDELAAFALVGSLAAWVTLHAIVSARLARTPPRWHGAAALLVPPFAPYWALRAGHRGLGLAWLVALAAWLVCRALFAR